MRRILQMVTAWMLIATPALAADYWVNPAGGNDGNSGQSVASAWASITKARSSTSAGDRIHLMPGSHSGSITGPSGTVWMGDAGNDTLAVVPGVSLGSSNDVTVKWIKSTSSISIAGGDRDSLHAITVRAPGRILTVSGDANDNVLSFITGSSTGSGTAILIDGGPADSDTSGHAGYVSRMTMNGCWFRFSSSSAVNSMIWASVKAAKVARNRFFSTHSNGSGSFVRHFQLLYSTLSDNYWEANSSCTSGCDEGANWTLRDKSYYNTFIRDTIIIRGAYTQSGRFMTSTGSVGGTYGNTWQSCVIVVKETLFNAGLPGDVWTGNQLVVRNNAFGTTSGYLYDNLVFTHNTVVGTNVETVFRNDRDSNSGGASNSVVRNNVFRSNSSNNSCYLTVYDSQIASRESNLYYRPGPTSQQVYQGNGCVPIGASSAWADPLVSAPLDFDTIILWYKAGQSPLSLLSGSPAFAASPGAPAWPDGYVGALPEGPPGTDTIPPFDIGDLGTTPTGF